VYRAGIRDTNNHCQKTLRAKNFDALSRAQQDEMLKDWTEQDRL